MSEATLLAIAKADLKIAKQNVNSSNKYEKHMAAYHVQQAIEKILKYEAGKKDLNLWGHDITKLVIQCRRAGIEIPEVIIENSAVYTNWEVVSRYYPVQVIRRDQIAKAIRITEQWIKEVK